jgi:hypothetical protein
MMREVRCKVCEAGILRQREVYRNSGPMVDIGYVLLAPSIPSVVICALAYGTLHSGGTEITSTGVPGSIFVFLGIAAFVSGVIGWLLIMKKQILVCNVCRAVVEPKMTARKPEASSAKLSH